MQAVESGSFVIAARELEPGERSLEQARQACRQAAQARRERARSWSWHGQRPEQARELERLERQARELAERERAGAGAGAVESARQALQCACEQALQAGAGRRWAGLALERGRRSAGRRARLEWGAELGYAGAALERVVRSAKRAELGLALEQAELGLAVERARWAGWSLAELERAEQVGRLCCP